MKLFELNILDTWTTLGGGPLRGRRVQAFWRGGNGLNVSIDLDRNTWYDFVASTGGGPLKLVEHVLQCDQTAALRWLELNCGLDPRKPLTVAERQELRDHRQERDSAHNFGVAAEALAEEVLEHLSPSDLRREFYTRLRGIARGGGLALIEEFRTWLANHPELTRAMALAGAASRARCQRLLAFQLLEVANAA